MQKDGERKISASDHRLYCYSGISPIANTKILLTKNVKALQISSLVELKSSIIMAKTTKNVRKYFCPLFYQIKIRGKRRTLFYILIKILFNKKIRLLPDTGNLNAFFTSFKRTSTDVHQTLRQGPRTSAPYVNASRVFMGSSRSGSSEVSGEKYWSTMSVVTCSKLGGFHCISKYIEGKINVSILTFINNLGMHQQN